MVNFYDRYKEPLKSCLCRLFGKFPATHREGRIIFNIWTVLHSFILHDSIFQIPSQSVVQYVFDSRSKSSKASQAI